MPPNRTKAAAGRNRRRPSHFMILKISPTTDRLWGYGFKLKAEV